VEIKNVPADIAPLVIQTIKAQKKLLSIIIKHRKKQSAAATNSRNDNSSNQLQHLHEWMDEESNTFYEIWKIYSLLSNYNLSSSWTGEKKWQ
jgi:hypothetical protein